MLNTESTETLTRVGLQTPMGVLLRSYWQPLLLSSEISEPDSPPVRVRHLGEDLIVFRDTSGRIGALGNHCPHRGASLFFGRNEEHGLRCVYHGWKFDVAGRCVDIPSEPAESNFKDKIRHLAYPCEERGGVVWAYMGRDGKAPGLPDFEWLAVPDTHRYITKHTQDCNWVQALEGDMDSSHVGFLHSTLNRRVPGLVSAEGPARAYLGENLQPRFETLRTDYGLLIGARRPIGEHNCYWRVTGYLMPFYAMIPPSGDAPLRVNIWQPVDDNNTVVWRIDYHPERPLTEMELADFQSGLFAHVGINDFLPTSSASGGRWRPAANKSNDYFIDRDLQRSSSFTGLRGFWLQDRVATESMGPIYDRSSEHLGSTDVGVIQVRRLLLEAAAALQTHGTPPPAVDPVCHRARAVAMEIPENASWVDAVRVPSSARPGVWRRAP